MQRFLRPVVLCLAGFCAGFPVSAGTFFDHNIPPTGFSDICTNPNDHWSWDLTTIRFKFDASFNTAFPLYNTSIKDQIRLALQQWGTANTTACGAIDTYLRNPVVTMPVSGGSGAFIDIRTTTVHEIGHVLGFGHPNQGIAVSRQYRPPGVNCAPPLCPQNNVNTTKEVMHAFASSGMCNHILTWDELADYHFSYPGVTLTFVEVPSTAAADIVFQGYTAAPGNIAIGLGAGVLRNNANPLAGTRVTSGTVQYNKNCVIPIGFRQHGLNWDMSTTLASGVAVHTISIRTRGTDNLTPVAIGSGFATYNGSSPWLFGAPTHTAFGVNQKDDITHRWTATTATDAPPGTTVHVGISLDVFDWQVVNAVAFDPALNSATLSITWFHDWWTDGVKAFVLPNDSSGPDLPAGQDAGFGVPAVPSVSPDETGMDEETTVITNVITAHGFIIGTSDAPSNHLANLKLADVTGRGLQLQDLNRPMLAQLQTNGVVITVTNFGQRTLVANDSFVVVFEGTTEGLPSALLQKGNFVLLNRPDLIGRQLFVAVDSSNSESTVGTFALVGTPALVGGGALPKLRIVEGTGATVQLYWPVAAEGFVLESSSALPATTWSTVGIPTTIIGQEYSVTVTNLQAHAFYRLSLP
jgi:hypothetical protein